MAGVEVLKEQCRGVTWELDIGRMAALRALEELGEIQEMARRAALLRREAEDNGDLYALVTALLTEGASRLAADDCPGARDLARRAMNLWTPSGFHLQHFYALRLEAYCDLYERRPLDAWRRLEQAWPGVQRSSLLRHAVLRTDAHLLRGAPGP